MVSLNNFTWLKWTARIEKVTDDEVFGWDLENMLWLLCVTPALAPAWKCTRAAHTSGKFCWITSDAAFPHLPFLLYFMLLVSMFASALNSLLQAHQINTSNGDQHCRHLYSCRKLAAHRTQLSPFHPQRMPIMPRQGFEEAPPGGIWGPKHWWHRQALQCHLLPHQDRVMDNLTWQWGDLVTPTMSGKELALLSPLHQPRETLTSSYLGRALR